MKKTVLCLSTFLIGLAGCGTIFNGPTQDISFQSNIQNVNVFVNGVHVCTTPCLYPLDRSNGSALVVAKKQGYLDQQIVLKPHFNTTAVGNLTFVFSWLTDLVSGGLWEYRPNSVYINMEKENMRWAEKMQFRHESRIRHYVLHTFPQLRQDAYFHPDKQGKFMPALMALTSRPRTELENIILTAAGEIDCIDRLLPAHP